MKARFAIFGWLLVLAGIPSPATGQAIDPFPPGLAAFWQHAPHEESATRMTLQEVEQEALRNNPEIRLAVRRVALAEARSRTAGALEDPQFMYRGWGTPLAKPWDLNQTQHMFMYSQNLPGAGKRQLQAKVGADAVEVAKADAEARNRDIVAQARTAFYALLRSESELRFHDEQVELARQSSESARIKYIVGKVPQQDMLKAQTALTRLVEHLLMLTQEGDLARAKLNTLMGRDPAALLEVAGEYTAEARLPGILELEKLALDNRPELTAVSAAIQQDETRSELAQKAFKPDYAVSGGYMLMPGDARYRNTYMAEFSVTLPWLNRQRHENEIAEAKAMVAADNAELAAQRSVVFGEIQESLVRARAAQRLADLYRDTMRPQAQAVLKATVAAYQNDRTDFLNLLDSQNTALEVELSYIRAQAEFETRLSDLERAVGTSLPRRGATAQKQHDSAQADVTLSVTEAK